MQAARVLAFGGAPSLEVVQLRQVLAFQQLAAKRRHHRRQTPGLERVEINGEVLVYADDVDLGASRVEGDELAIGADARLAGLVHQRAELAQAPAQGAARVVRNVPK